MVVLGGGVVSYERGTPVIEILDTFTEELFGRSSVQNLQRKTMWSFKKPEGHFEAMRTDFVRCR